MIQEFHGKPICRPEHYNFAHLNQTPWGINPRISTLEQEIHNPNQTTFLNVSLHVCSDFLSVMIAYRKRTDLPGNALEPYVLCLQMYSNTKLTRTAPHESCPVKYSSYLWELCTKTCGKCFEDTWIPVELDWKYTKTFVKILFSSDGACTR